MKTEDDLYAKIRDYLTTFSYLHIHLRVIFRDRDIATLIIGLISSNSLICQNQISGSHTLYLLKRTKRITT